MDINHTAYIIDLVQLKLYEKNELNKACNSGRFL